VFQRSLVGVWFMVPAAVTVAPRMASALAEELMSHKGAPKEYNQHYEPRITTRLACLPNRFRSPR